MSKGMKAMNDLKDWQIPLVVSAIVLSAYFGALGLAQLIKEI